MNLTISLEALHALARGWREAPAFTRRELLAATSEATLLLQGQWQENMPVGANGLTRRSVISDVFTTPAGVLGVVGSSQPSALFVELGTRPHMPPVAAMVPWVKAVLGISEPKEVQRVAYLVARKIAREGTPAQRPMGRAVDDHEGQVLAMYERAAGRVAAHLAGGAA